MQNKIKGLDVLVIFITILLTVTTVAGLLSFGTDKAYTFVNQYGDTVKLYGKGIYAHDSYFKAPILIGSDFTMLLLVVPMTIIALKREVKNRNIKSKLFLISILGTVFYYAASISFGVTYNSLMLVYIALFSCSLFAMITLIMRISADKLKEAHKSRILSNGLAVFLILSGISLFVAWLPDIITSLIQNTSLSLIEVYTTEITYVLDMGVISPLMFICLFLLKKEQGLGDIVLVILLKACEIIGVMMIFQTLFQTMADINLPIPALVTKVMIFIVLSCFAFYFDCKFYRNLREI